MLREANENGPVRNAAELVAGLLQRIAESSQINSLVFHEPPLRPAEGETLRMIEGLIEGGHECGNPLADAVFESSFTGAQRLSQTGVTNTRQPVMMKGMAGHFMAGSMDSTNLSGIVIRTRTRQRGRADDGKTSWYPKLLVNFQELFCVLEIEVPPLFRSAAAPRTVGAPLRVVIPKAN
jgi:hypothetical protein